jgi:hypothetical protein
MNNRKRYLETCSLYLAAYLYANGVEMAGMNVFDGRVLFCFVRSPESEILAEEFENSQEALVDARRYANALEILECERQEELMKSDARET